MGRFILNAFFVLVIFTEVCGQYMHDFVLDTLIKVDEVYLDPLNQIYFINNVEKSITKYNILLEPLKKISFNQGWDHALMDVSDPFKCILYYPGDYKIFVLDESLAVIASHDESELNAQSAVCHFTTDYIAIFSNNILKLKNYEQQKIISAEPIYQVEKENSHHPYQLKQSNEYLYLLKPDYGIYRYTNQLFEENYWTRNAVIKKMDVTGDVLFYISDHDLIKFDTKTKMEEVILKEEPGLKSFAVNSEYLVILLEDRLRLIKLE